MSEQTHATASSSAPDLSTLLAQHLPGEEVHALASADGIQGARVAPSSWRQAAKVVSQELSFGRFIDLTCVDTLADEGRFELHLLVYSLAEHRWARVKTRVDDEVASLGEELPSALAYEREIFDLFGVRFAGHPRLTRLLLPDDWTGHPLRRDEPLVSEPVDFVTTRAVYGTGA